MSIHLNHYTLADYPLNSILYGPPGTGKTYAATLQALALIERKEIHEVEREWNSLRPTFDGLTIRERYLQYIKEGRILHVCFHPSYTYEDWVEGIKPEISSTSDQKGISYSICSGQFKKLCQNAYEGISLCHVWDRIPADGDMVPTKAMLYFTKILTEAIENENNEVDKIKNNIQKQQNEAGIKLEVIPVNQDTITIFSLPSENPDSLHKAYPRISEKDEIFETIFQRLSALLNHSKYYEVSEQTNNLCATLQKYTSNSTNENFSTILKRYLRTLPTNHAYQRFLKNLRTLPTNHAYQKFLRNKRNFRNRFIKITENRFKKRCIKNRSLKCCVEITDNESTRDCEKLNEFLASQKKGTYIFTLHFYPGESYQDFQKRCLLLQKGYQADVTASFNKIFSFSEQLYKQLATYFQDGHYVVYWIPSQKIIIHNRASQSHKKNQNKFPVTIYRASPRGHNANSNYAQNIIRQNCLEHSHIRVGWLYFYSDYPSSNLIEQIGDFSKYGKKREKFAIGKDSINNLFHNMKIGDIVFLPCTNTQTDGIGVVRSTAWADHSFDLNNDDQNTRRVQWLVKFIKPISAFTYNNNKKWAIETLLRPDGFNANPENVAKILKRTKPYVVIIDEINRGNLPQIFGELITLLEPSKRYDVADRVFQETINQEANKNDFKPKNFVQLPYSQQDFGIPDNVYVIGTMNTSDRSLIHLDTALRRRFHFIQINPDPELLKDIFIRITDSFYDRFDYRITHQYGNLDIKKFFIRLNDQLIQANLQNRLIGHSYFLPLKNEKLRILLADILQHQIIPLLEDYFYKNFEKALQIIQNAFQNSFQEQN